MARMTVRSSKSDNFYFFIYCHIWVKMVQYFHKLIKIIPQILKLLGIKTTKGRKLIGLSMELLWRLGYHYEAFNTQSRKKRLVASLLARGPTGFALAKERSAPFLGLRPKRIQTSNLGYTHFSSTSFKSHPEAIYTNPDARF